TNSTPTCVGGTCAFVCNSGFSKCGNACCPSGPRHCDVAARSRCTRNADQVFNTCAGGCPGGFSGRNCRLECAADRQDAYITCNNQFGCPGGESCCNGVCGNLVSDNQNCGACANVCSLPANARDPVCVGRVCSFTCNSGFTKCGNVCCSP